MFYQNISTKEINYAYYKRIQKHITPGYASDVSQNSYLLEKCLFAIFMHH